MKFKRISQDEAEKIIVYGKGAGFSVIKIAGINYTIYHRIYGDIFYNIAQMSFYDEIKEKPMYKFYIFDNKDVKTILGIDPEKDTRAVIAQGECGYM